MLQKKKKKKNSKKKMHGCRGIFYEMWELYDVTL